ncbi:hypothetical protein [Desertivirga brevis]|uniref:hypothetical protein n=1 Tax=Desertivirga brevis TaxID=2810310 RepID=UPI001A96E76A|nr:hypothetical protein [Pedobacter sp. SYSU D00873]
MENFTTQFYLSGATTTVTVRIASEKEFDFVLHFADEFDGGDLTPSEKEIDGTLLKKEDGSWVQEEGGKIHLAEHDVKSLGEAIDNDYLNAQPKNDGN